MKWNSQEGLRVLGICNTAKEKFVFLKRYPVGPQSVTSVAAPLLRVNRGGCLLTVVWLPLRFPGIVAFLGETLHFLFSFSRFSRAAAKTAARQDIPLRGC